MRNSRARQSAGDRFELVYRGAHLREGGDGLLGGGTCWIYSLDGSVSPATELRLDESTEVGGHGDSLAECCLSEGEPLVVLHGDSSNLGLGRHGVSTMLHVARGCKCVIGAGGHGLSELLGCAAGRGDVRGCGLTGSAPGLGRADVAERGGADVAGSRGRARGDCLWRAWLEGTWRQPTSPLHTRGTETPPVPRFTTASHREQSRRWATRVPVTPPRALGAATASPLSVRNRRERGQCGRCRALRRGQ